MNALVPLGFKLCRSITTTAVLNAEPRKKKKRIDPILLKVRNERKAKRLERSIIKMEKAPKQYKPIVELSLAPHVVKEKEIRIRQEKDLQAEEDYRKMLKLWMVYRMLQSRQEYKCMRRVTEAQNKALFELRQLSPSLWEKAVAFDDSLIPYESKDSIKHTPANPNYQPPDGHVTETTKKWEM